MKKETFLFVAVIALLVLNLGTLGYLFMGRTAQHGFPPSPANGFSPPPGAHRPIDQLIIETLKLTDQQQQQFDVLKREHHEAMTDLDRQYNGLLREYFDLLKPGSDEHSKDGLEKKLADIQSKKASMTYDHFKQLKAMLTPAQQPQFDSLLPELMHIIAPPENNPPPERRD